jgi:hypothetical protein
MDAVRLYSTRSGRIVEERRIQFSVDESAGGEEDTPLVEDARRTARVLAWARRVAPRAALARPAPSVFALSGGEPYSEVVWLTSALRRSLWEWVEWDEEFDAMEPEPVMVVEVRGGDTVALFASYNGRLISEPRFLPRATWKRLEAEAALDVSR